MTDTTDYLELTPKAGLKIDLRYASTNNFVGRDLYGDRARAVLHRLAWEKLNQAIEFLLAEHPGHQLVVFDALRPRSVQKVLWDVVKGTEQQKYVADPEKGSIHNYGLAVDISVCGPDGQELDMGTEFDAFTSLAEPQEEENHLREGRLTTRQFENRLVLRNAMESAGFIQLPWEWWHFEALNRTEIRAKYRIIE